MLILLLIIKIKKKFFTEKVLQNDKIFFSIYGLHIAIYISHSLVQFYQWANTRSKEIQAGTANSVQLIEMTFSHSQLLSLYFIFLIILGQSWITSLILFTLSGVMQVISLYLCNFNVANFSPLLILQMVCLLWFHRLSEKQNKMMFYEMFK